MMSIHEATLADEADGAPVEPSRWTSDRSASSPPFRASFKFPVRIKCATLSWNTLVQALNEAEPQLA